MRSIVLAAVIILLWLAANGKLIAAWDAATVNMRSSK